MSVSPLLRRATGVVLFALLGAGPALWATHAVAAPTVTFGIEPASGTGDTRSSLSYGLAPGSSATDRIAIVNYSSQALPVEVYGADASGRGANFTLAAPDASPTDVGSWLTFSDKQSVHITVPGRRTDAGGTQAPGRTVIPVRLAIGAQAAAGEHAGGVVVSLESASGSNVTLEQRVALRVYVDVMASGHPSASASVLLPGPAANEQRASKVAPIWTGIIALLLPLCFASWRAGRIVLARRNHS